MSVAVALPTKEVLPGGEEFTDRRCLLAVHRISAEKAAKMVWLKAV
jgi:hypothetical protein